jgi:plastocyanin
MRLALGLAISTIAVLTFVACAGTAGSGATAAPAASAPSAKAAAVTIKGFAFSPATLTVDKGTVVTWTNNDGTTHTVTSGTNRTPDGKFDQEISNSTEASVTFDTLGTFEYFCRNHNTMKGTVTVK